MSDSLSTYVHIRLTRQERDGLKRIALQNGLTLTAFIRDALEAAIADSTDEPVLTVEVRREPVTTSKKQTA